MISQSVDVDASTSNVASVKDALAVDASRQGDIFAGCPFSAQTGIGIRGHDPLTRMQRAANEVVVASEDAG